MHVCKVLTPACPVLLQEVFNVIELVSVIIFTIEYVIRFACCPTDNYVPKQFKSYPNVYHALVFVFVRCRHSILRHLPMPWSHRLALDERPSHRLLSLSLRPLPLR